MGVLFLSSALLTLSCLGIVGFVGILTITYPHAVPGRIILRYWHRFQIWRNRAKEVEQASLKRAPLKREDEAQVQIPAEAVHGYRRAASAEETLTQMQDFAKLHPAAAALAPFQRLYGALELLLTIESILSAEQRQSVAISLSWQWRQWHHAAQRMEQQTA